MVYNFKIYQTCSNVCGRDLKPMCYNQAHICEAVYYSDFCLKKFTKCKTKDTKC